MATFALIHGGGSTAWDWHLVTPLLESAGHEVVAVDLPIEEAGNGLEEYVSVVADAIGDRTGVIVVGHSLGGFTAPLLCDSVQADGLVYLAAMIPMPGESFVDWWANTGHDQETIDDDPDFSFFNGVPATLAAEANRRTRDQQGDWMSRPWPAQRHPAAPTRAILAVDDNFFPAPFMERQIRDRLGIEPVAVPGGHYVSLTAPDEVAAELIRFAVDITNTRGRD